MSPDATTVSLNRRIEQFEAGDAVPITRPEALGELVSLVHSPDVLRDGLPLPMIQLAGGFHWCRAKARSRGSDDLEFVYATSLMARHIDGLAGLEFDKHYLAFLANDFLVQVGTGEDEPLKQAAIDFASDVSDLLYDVHPALPVLLANLALTHESRFAALRNRRDLDQAIDRTRSSLALIADGLPQKPMLRNRLISLLETRSEEDASAQDSSELAAIRASAAGPAPSARPRPDFRYDLRSLSVSPTAFKPLIERALFFPRSEELADHLSETKAGDLVVGSALRRLDFAALAESLVENGYSDMLATKLADGPADSVAFSFPLIGAPLKALNHGLASSGPGRRILESLAACEAGQSLSTSLLCRRWDWASRIFIDLAGSEGTEQVLRAVAHAEGGRELARLLAATDEGATFLRKMIDDRWFLLLGRHLLSTGPSRRFLADLCGSPACEVLIEELLARDDAEQLLADIRASSYAADVLTPLADSGELADLHEAIADSAKRSRLAERLAAGEGDADAGRTDLATLLLPALMAPVLKLWLASLGVAATAEVVYVAAVIAVTHRSSTSDGRSDEPRNDDELWIPPSTHYRPPQDSDLWKRVLGARLNDGIPAVDASDIEDSERLAGAVHRYMTTKDLSRPAPDHQDRILLRLIEAWHLADGDHDEGRSAVEFGDRLQEEPEFSVNLEDLQEAVRAALEGTPRERWTKRIKEILVGVTAGGIVTVTPAIVEAVARLMGLAPSPDAQVYEIDKRLAQDLDRWRAGAREGLPADSPWTSDDELALIFCIHALSLVTISGAYQRRHPPRDGTVGPELVAPAIRMNGEFTTVHAQNLGMDVFYT
ncbi:hypothetical protein GCM10010402_05870 [Actinomadura luteofluorescens]|nr:hypothetical protein [Actinomadura glauciflava]